MGYIKSPSSGKWEIHPVCNISQWMDGYLHKMRRGSDRGHARDSPFPLPSFRPRKVATLGAIMVFDKHDSKSGLVSISDYYLSSTSKLLWRPSIKDSHKIWTPPCTAFGRGSAQPPFKWTDPSPPQCGHPLWMYPLLKSCIIYAKQGERTLGRYAWQRCINDSSCSFLHGKSLSIFHAMAEEAPPSLQQIPFPKGNMNLEGGVRV